MSKKIIKTVWYLINFLIFIIYPLVFHVNWINVNFLVYLVSLIIILAPIKNIVSYVLKDEMVDLFGGPIHRVAQDNKLGILIASVFVYILYSVGIFYIIMIKEGYFN